MTNYSYAQYGQNVNSGRSPNAENGWGGYRWPQGVPENLLGIAEYGDVKLKVRKELVTLVYTLMRVSEDRYKYNLHGPHERPPAGECWGYSNRAIAGTNTASNHSKGRAVDLNAPSNPYTSPLVCDIPPSLINTWEKAGFYWGGRYSGSKDAMHLEYAYTPADVARHLMYAKSQLVSSAPTPPAPKPPVIKNPYPLPSGFYYGPKSGPNNCISGMAGETQAWIDGLVKGQRQLMARMPGCLPKYGADGKYGLTPAGETYEAVKKFQRANGLSVDGLLGKNTWTKLFS